jgi:hypothetical protein
MDHSLLLYFEHVKRVKNAAYIPSPVHPRGVPHGSWLVTIGQ